MITEIDEEGLKMEHKGTKELQTERLILRPWRESDAEEAFANWMNDPDVTKYLT